MPEELLDDGNALGMLRAEHEAIRALLSNVLVRDAAFAQQALTRALEELEIHREMERQYFIPLCERNINLVTEDRMEGGMQHTMVLDELTRRLEQMNVTDEDFAITMEQLLRAFQQHCFAFEENFFVALEGKDWQMHQELTATAILMRDLRERMLATMARPRTAENPTFQDMQQRRAQEQGRGVWGPRDVTADDEVKDSEDGQDLTESTTGDVIDMGRKSLDIDSEEGTTGR